MAPPNIETNWHNQVLDWAGAAVKHATYNCGNCRRCRSKLGERASVNGTRIDVFDLDSWLAKVTAGLDAGDAISSGSFVINEGTARGIARYLWCCLCWNDGILPDTNTFRGMPVMR